MVMPALKKLLVINSDSNINVLTFSNSETNDIDDPNSYS